MNWRDFQARQHYAEIGERFISYLDEGTNASESPVVFLHGIPTWGYLWHEIVPALAASGRRVLAPDLAGFGFSDKRDTFDRSIARQAELIEMWLEQTGIASADFVAHDLGGGVALRLATLFPRRVRRLCLMNSVCYDAWPIEMMLQLGHPGADRKMSANTALSTLKTALKQGFATSPADAVMSGLLAPYSTEVGKLSLMRDAAALNTNLTTEITPLLKRIDAPTLVLWGVDDPFLPIRWGERLAWDIPAARLTPIQDASHFVMLDQPQRVSAELQAFLN